MGFRLKAGPLSEQAEAWQVKAEPRRAGDDRGGMDRDRQTVACRYDGDFHAAHPPGSRGRPRQMPRLQAAEGDEAGEKWIAEQGEDHRAKAADTDQGPPRPAGMERLHERAQHLSAIERQYRNKLQEVEQSDDQRGPEQPVDRGSPLRRDIETMEIDRRVADE